MNSKVIVSTVDPTMSIDLDQSSPNFGWILKSGARVHQLELDQVTAALGMKDFANVQEELKLLYANLKNVNTVQET